MQKTFHLVFVCESFLLSQLLGLEDY